MRSFQKICYQREDLAECLGKKSFYIHNSGNSAACNNHLTLGNAEQCLVKGLICTRCMFKVVQGGSTRASPSRRAQTNNNPCMFEVKFIMGLVMSMSFRPDVD